MRAASRTPGGGRHSQAVGLKDRSVTQHSRGSFRFGQRSGLFTGRPAPRLCIERQHSQALGRADEGSNSDI
jgi:hypothetical protein